MKKTIFVAVLALLSCAAVSAQDRERMSDEDRAKAIAERIEKAADRMAKDFDLKDEAKATFISTYTNYQKEMLLPIRLRASALNRPSVTRRRN